MPASTDILNAVWPPVCPVSGRRVDGNGHITPKAWSTLTFLSEPWCRICGYPFSHSGGPSAGLLPLCGPCAAKAPVFDTARSPLAYDDAARPLVLGFKHGGQRQMISQFARWMAMAAAGAIAESDLVMPVPLHWRRLMSRHFNQSTLLGRALAQLVERPFSADILLRGKSTPSQAGRSAKARRRNVAGAFHIRHASRLRCRNVLLVDDVFTTGATVSACSRLLKRVGAGRVHIVTLCRVVRERDPTI